MGDSGSEPQGQPAPDRDRANQNESQSSTHESDANQAASAASDSDAEPSKASEVDKAEEHKELRILPRPVSRRGGAQRPPCRLQRFTSVQKRTCKTRRNPPAG